MRDSDTGEAHTENLVGHKDDRIRAVIPHAGICAGAVGHPTATLQVKAMSNESLKKNILEVCVNADKILYAKFPTTKSQVTNIGKLIYPKYRNNKPRVSEQEARFAFVEALLPTPFYYSVETPTSKKYSFSGKASISAQTDLTIYDRQEKKICNVEFKAKGITSSAKNHLSIDKDVQKLLREPVWGLWFHLFEAVDNSTINSFLHVFNEGVKEVNRTFQDIAAPGLSIHICVIKQHFSLHYDTTPSADSFTQDMLNIKVSRSQLLTVNKADKWKVIEL